MAILFFTRFVISVLEMETKMPSVGNVSFCGYRVYVKGSATDGKPCAYPTQIIKDTLKEAQEEIRATIAMQRSRNEKPLEYKTFGQKAPMGDILKAMGVETIFRWNWSRGK